MLTLIKKLSFQEKLSSYKLVYLLSECPIITHDYEPLDRFASNFNLIEPRDSC